MRTKQYHPGRGTQKLINTQIEDAPGAALIARTDRVGFYALERGYAITGRTGIIISQWANRADAAGDYGRRTGDRSLI